jgi:uncharacterized integral membrane protein (TIGR00697 family)
VIVFPVSYILNDCIAEVWGFRKARLIIWMGFLMNFFVVSLGAIATVIPSPPFWEGEEAFRFVFGLAPRIAAASLMAFLVGSFLNAWVMSRMKVASSGKGFGWRAILSSVGGELADSLIVFPAVFWGVLPLAAVLQLAVSQVIAKLLYEVVALPLTAWFVNGVKRAEGIDTYDHKVSYNPFKIKDF